MNDIVVKFHNSVEAIKLKCAVYNAQSVFCRK